MNSHNCCCNTNHPVGHEGRHEHICRSQGHPVECLLVSEVCMLTPVSSRATRVEVTRTACRTGNVQVEVVGLH